MRLILPFLAVVWSSSAGAQSLSGMGPAPNVAFTFATSGLLGANEQLPGISWTSPVTLSRNLSTGTCTTAAMADTKITVFNGGTPIATVDYQPGNPLPVIDIISAPLGAGAFVYAVAPSTQDASLAGVSFTLGGR
ncbi:MAG: hypothetical protein H0X27_03620 [Caulobacteraceae bacterium]|nr:hypothetical protein [Caulobacteraceae bacterium]